MKNYSLYRRIALVICAVLWKLSSLFALDYYWVGGSGLWSDHNNHWATTSGGAIFHDQVPQSMDNVFFDANSFPSGGTVTIDQTIIYCHNMDWTGAGNMPVLSGPGDKQVWIYGSLKLISGMQWNVLGEVHFRAFQTGKTITSMGKEFIGDVFFDGTGGGWTLLDAFRANYHLRHLDGALHTNGQDLTVGYRFYSSGTVTSSLHFGSSNIYIGGLGQSCTLFEINYTLNFDAGTSTIYMKGPDTGSSCIPRFNGGNKTYYNLICEVNVDVSGNNNFHSATFLKNANISGSNQYNILTFSAGQVYTLSSGTIQTINTGGDFNANGSCMDFLTIVSNNTGSAAQIKKSTGSVVLDYLVLQDIHATGGAPFSATNSADLGNNTGWTFPPAATRNLYWVGGNGNWNDPSHWSLSSGGAGGECIPTPFDNVFFNQNSGFSAPSQKVNINPLIAFCQNMDWTGALFTPTLAGPSQHKLFIFGSLKFISLMNLTFTGEVHFMAHTPGKTITSAGRKFQRDVYFDGLGGGWTFIDAFHTNYRLYHLNGALYTNGQDVTVAYRFYSQGSASRILQFSSSNIYIGSISSTCILFLIDSATNFDAGTSTIYMKGLDYVGNCIPTFSGGNKTFYNLICEVTTELLNFNNNFHSATFLKGATINGNNNFDILTFTAGQVYNLRSGRIQTINPNGTFNGNGVCSNFLTIVSTNIGSAAQIKKTTGSLALNYVMLQDIHAAGGTTFSATNSADLGNNAGWTFLPSTPRNLYWVGGAGNWNDPGHWSLSSGGTGGECIPTPFDNVFFDQNSGFSQLGQQVILNPSIAFCKDMDWTGVLNSPNLVGFSYSKLYIYGSLKFVPGMNLTFNGDVYFKARTSGKTITSAGKIFNRDVFFDGIGGGWTLLDAFQSGYHLRHLSGALYTNGQDLTVGYRFYSSGSSARTLSFGNSNVYIGGLGFHCTLFEISNTTNFNAGTSTIYIKDPNNGGNCAPRFYGGNHSFYNLICEATTDITNNGCNFHSVTFLKSARIYGNNSYESLSFSPGATYEIGAYSTQTITPLGDFIAEGYGGFPIEIKSTNLGIQAILHKDGDPVCLDFLYMTDIKASGSAFTYAGANSDDVFNNTDWLFEACPDCFTAMPQTPPTLDPASVTAVFSGQQATLIVCNPPTGYEVLWFNESLTAELYASTANLFQPTINKTTTFYGALRDLSTGCVSALLEVVVYACPRPTLTGAHNVCQNSAELRWVSNDTPTNNCWVVTVGPAGMAIDAFGCPQSEQALFSTTVCFNNDAVSFYSPVTSMTVVGSQISIIVSGLLTNTNLAYYVSETCDGIPPPFHVSSCAGPVVFSTLETPYSVNAIAEKPLCTYNSPGYVPNGSFTVTITEGSTCPGQYSISASPIANSGPLNTTPPVISGTNYIDQPAGSYLFSNAGVGCYTVTIQKSNSANPLPPMVVQVCVPDGTDLSTPIFSITDALGNILADNDPQTSIGMTVNFETASSSESSCGRHDEYYVYGFDNCDGFIVANNAVSVSASPGTQVTVTPDGFGFYLVDVNWGIGASEVTVTGRDAAGNTIDLILQMNVIDNIAPIVSCFNTSVDFNGDSNLSLDVNNLVSASDNCGIQNVTISTDNVSCAQIGQVVPVTVTATDYNSNSASCVAQVTVSGLPCGWSSYNGTVGCGSSAAYNPTSRVWSLTGSNCYYTSPYTSDALAFARRSLCGNGSITAQVTSINGTSMGWAGVIMRESNALGAKKAQLMTNLSSLHRRELRVVTNGQAFPQQFASSGRYWLRIVRQGNQFTGYASANGTDWIPVMAQIIAMNACIEIGLVVTNYQQNSTVTATFANVSHTGNGGQALAPPAILDLLQAAPMTVDFSVFPNPTSGMLNLDLTQYIGLPVHIEVYNLQGKLLHFAEVQEVQTAIKNLDLSGFHSGMYLVRVTTREFPVVTKRVVVDGKK